MADLVTIDELRSYLRMPTLDADNAAPVLAGVSALVRAYTGRVWAADTEEDARVNGTGSVSLLLPKLPVISVDEITEDPDGIYDGPTVLTADTQYEWDPDGLVRRVDGGIFARRLRFYGVTYTHGEDPPDDVKLVVLRVCARAAVNPEGLVQEATAGYSAVFGQDAGRFATLAEPDERDLNPYRVTV